LILDFLGDAADHSSDVAWRMHSTGSVTDRDCG
jgi:hypothetical protein